MIQNQYTIAMDVGYSLTWMMLFRPNRTSLSRLCLSNEQDGLMQRACRFRNILVARQRTPDESRAIAAMAKDFSLEAIS